MKKVSTHFMLSLYGPTDYGMGHITDGRPADPNKMEGWYRVSISESMNGFEDLLTAFAEKEKANTGQIIKVTIEAVPQ